MVTINLAWVLDWLLHTNSEIGAHERGNSIGFPVGRSYSRTNTGQPDAGKLSPWRPTLGEQYTRRAHYRSIDFILNQNRFHQQTGKRANKQKLKRRSGGRLAGTGSNNHSINKSLTLGWLSLGGARRLIAWRRSTGELAGGAAGELRLEAKNWKMTRRPYRAGRSQVKQI